MLSFADAPGNLFNRIGKLGNLLQEMDAYQAAQLFNITDTTFGAVAQYNGESDIQALLGGAYIGQLNGVGMVGTMSRAVAGATVNRMVFRDNPQIAQNLVSLNVLTSLKEVIRQMGIAGATVLAQTITATGSSFTGVGNGVIRTSVRRPLDGLVLENAFAENLLFTCSSDSYSGGVFQGNERFLVTGTGQQNNPYAFDWPLGSGAQTGVSAIDGLQDNSSGNLLTNSGFDSWQSNVPNNWSLTVGTAGVNISQETAIVYDPPNGSSLTITGDAGGTLTSLQQQFGESSGTLGTLNPFTQYAVNMFLRRDGIAAAAGVLTVELVDENGVVILDEGANPNSFTIALTGLTTVFTAYGGSFRMPAIVPDEVYLRMRLSTALTNNRNVYLDKISMGQMTQVYVSGPFVSVHAGATPFVVNDYATVAVTNSRGAAGTLSTFQTLFARLFSDMIGSELLLPSSNVPSISDSLI